MNDSFKMFLVALVTAVAVQLLLGPYILRLQGFGGGATAPALSGPVEAGPQAAPAPTPSVRLAAPNLGGMTVKAAQDRFRDKGIKIIEDEERPDPTAAPGTILQQRPAAGAALSNMEIHVVVAKAHEAAQVPDVIGMPVEDARKTLVEAGFEVPDATQEASDQPVGTVIKQAPNPGAASKQGSIVRVVVSQSAAIAVPKVTSKYLRSARKALEAAGLTVGSIRRVEHEEHGQNFVLRQEPSAGNEVPPGTAIDLVVVAPN